MYNFRKFLNISGNFSGSEWHLWLVLNSPQCWWSWLWTMSLTYTSQMLVIACVVLQVKIQASDFSGLWYGACTLNQLIRLCKTDGIPQIHVSIYIKAILWDLIKRSPFMYILPNKFSVVYINRLNIEKKILWIWKLNLYRSCSYDRICNNYFPFTGIPVNLILYRKSCIQNISILWKITNMNTLRTKRYGDNHGNLMMKKVKSIFFQLWSNLVVLLKQKANKQTKTKKHTLGE